MCNSPRASKFLSEKVWFLSKIWNYSLRRDISLRIHNESVSSNTFSPSCFPCLRESVTRHWRLDPHQWPNGTIRHKSADPFRAFKHPTLIPHPTIRRSRAFNTGLALHIGWYKGIVTRFWYYSFPHLLLLSTVRYLLRLPCNNWHLGSTSIYEEFFSKQW